MSEAYYEDYPRSYDDASNTYASTLGSYQADREHIERLQKELLEKEAKAKADADKLTGMDSFGIF